MPGPVSFLPSFLAMLSIVYLIVLAASLLLILAVAVAVAFTTPIAFEGNVVKLQAQYTPKVLQLGPKNSKNALAGKSVAKSYWGIVKRVYRLEGWRGLLKGIGLFQR
ncbi:hypothetical protein BDN67DRAFT_973931 [Paxillus ammoniavirescens]|nr:hypothetical protein BDN67DRAFT_973931 [Paxillus ammoniavirescens]